MRGRWRSPRPIGGSCSDGRGARARRPGWWSGPGSCCWPATECRANRSPRGSAAPSRRWSPWRRRYAERGLPGLADLPRPGTPSPLPEALRDRVLELTLTSPPTAFGATHWSSRLLATALAAEGTPISHATIARIWHPLRRAAVASGDVQVLYRPGGGGQLRDVVGLYLHPPTKAVVLC